MSTIVIDVNDKSSAKLFLELAKKLHFKAHVLTKQQKEDWALLAMMGKRSKEPALAIDSTLKLLAKAKSK